MLKLLPCLGLCASTGCMHWQESYHVGFLGPQDLVSFFGNPTKNCFFQNSNKK